MKSLIKLVRSNPGNERLARQFFTAYEAMKDPERSYDLTYLQLKWFCEEEKWRYMNEISKIYSNIGKNRIAFMCLIGSLQSNPYQPGIFELAQSLREMSKPRIPDSLGKDTVSVSVIMPTYNREFEIKESIKSVLNQSFRDFELIIINDGGTDGVKEVVNSFCSDKIKYYKLENNKGLSGALNEGILKAEGKYIAYLDDDDVYYPGHLENLISSIKKKTRYDFVYSNAWWCSGEIKDKSYVERTRKLLDRRPRRFDRQLLMKHNYISTLNILHKKQCFGKAGLFNEDLEMLMDWEMWMRFSHDFKFYQVNDITGEYRFKENNMSAVDQLTMSFLSMVIRRFYETYYGKIIEIKQYLRTNQKEKAEEIFDVMLLNYSRCSLSARKELFYLSRKFPYWKSRGLLGKLAIDFIKYKAVHFMPGFFKKKQSRNILQKAID